MLAIPFCGEELEAQRGEQPAPGRSACMRQIPNVLGCSLRCEAAWGSDEFKRPQYSTRSALEAPGGLASPKGGGFGRWSSEALSTSWWCRLL